MESLIPLILQYKYLIIFPLAVVEGPVLALTCGFLIYLGYLEIIPTYLVFIAGDVVPDIVYYFIGHFGSKSKLVAKYKLRWGIIYNNLGVIERLWEKHTGKMMLLSKFAFGLSAPLLVSAGLVGMSFRKFISSTLPISIINYAAILTIGYYLGHSYQLAEKYLQYSGIVVTVLLVLFIVGYRFISKYARSEVIKLEKKEETES
jgi:membrane protein DedA with SNARE-associated domain